MNPTQERQGPGLAGDATVHGDLADRTGRLAPLVDWRLYAVLSLATVLAVAIGYPYAAQLGGVELNWAGLARMVLGNGLPSFVAVFVGCLCTASLGLDAPFVRAWVHGECGPSHLVRESFIWAPLIGAAVGLVVIPIDLVLTSLRLGTTVGGAVAATIEARAAGGPGPFASLAAMFYGGVFEEVSLRFFVMSMWAWVVAFIVSRIRKERVRPYPAVMIAAVVVAAVAFGAGHLVTAGALADLTPLYVARVLLLNTIPGLAFGMLFWRVGLEAAIVAHMATDVVLHVLFPLALGVW